jgi:hypothetical protein
MWSARAGVDEPTDIVRPRPASRAAARLHLADPALAAEVRTVRTASASADRTVTGPTMVTDDGTVAARLSALEP